MSPGDDLVEGGAAVVAVDLVFVFGGSEVPPNHASDLLRDEVSDSLPLPDASHPPDALGDVAQRAAFSDRDGRFRIDALLDVHTDGVHLVVERESPLLRHAKVRQPRRGRIQGLAAQNRLLVALVVDVDDGIEGVRGQQGHEPVGGLPIAESRDDRSGVDERVEHPRRSATNHGVRLVLFRDAAPGLAGHHIWVRRPGEADLRGEEHAGSQVDTARPKLQPLHLERLRECVVLQVERLSIRQVLENEMKGDHLRVLVRLQMLQERNLLILLLEIHARRNPHARVPAPRFEALPVRARAVRAVVFPHPLLQSVGKDLHVLTAKAHVAVRKDGEPDGHIRRGELGRRRRGVLADERNGK
eukprot:scaffold5011_cov255-Pinguiococcus_pyrenoidosus.AAC.5